MPGTWMDWAKLIGTFIGATVIAIAAGWQLYTRLIRPLIKRFEPIINEIKGPGDEPGLRQLVNDVGDTAKSGLRAALQAAEGVTDLRRDVRNMTSEHHEMRRDMDTIKSSQRDQGQRIGSVEMGMGELKGRVDTIEKLHVERGSIAPAPRAGEVTGGGQQVGPARGPDSLEKLAPPPPQPGTLSERKP